MWLVKEGVRIEYAEDVHKVTEGPKGDSLSLLCPTRHIRSRGDTLNLPTLSLVCLEITSLFMIAIQLTIVIH